VRREQVAPAHFERIREVQRRTRFRGGLHRFGHVRYLAQSRSQCVRIAAKLGAARIGQILPVARKGELHQYSDHGPQEDEEKGDQVHHRIASAAPAALPRRLPAAAAVHRPLREEGPYWLFRPGLVRDLKPCGKGDGVPAARYAELIEVTRAAVLVAAGGIRAAECAPMPGEICDFCPFPDICRPDEAAV